MITLLCQTRITCVDVTVYVEILEPKNVWEGGSIICVQFWDGPWGEQNWSFETLANRNEQQVKPTAAQYRRGYTYTDIYIYIYVYISMYMIYTYWYIHTAPIIWTNLSKAYTYICDWCHWDFANLELAPRRPVFPRKGLPQKLQGADMTPHFSLQRLGSCPWLPFMWLQPSKHAWIFLVICVFICTLTSQGILDHALLMLKNETVSPVKQYHEI